MTPERLSIPDLLRRYGLRPEKSLGQNFLSDERALQQIVEIAGLTTEDCVLEIGPGLGSLTRWLAETARQVVAVELDQHLFAPLQEVLRPYSNVRLIQGDILSFAPDELLPAEAEASGYLVVANIPYYLTSALIRHLLEARRKPRRLVLTVQKEVAERICAAPGSLSLLALSVQVYGQPQLATHIRAEAFYPPPKVDSAVVRVDLLPQPRLPAEHLPMFFQLAKAGFSQKRKTLRNSLAAGMRWRPPLAGQILRQAGIDPQRRAETLNLLEWKRLTEAALELAPEDHQHPSQEAQTGREQQGVL